MESELQQVTRLEQINNEAAEQASAALSKLIDRTVEVAISKAEVKKVAELNKARDFFRNDLFQLKSLSKEECMIIGAMSQIIELILDLSEIRVALED